MLDPYPMAEVLAWCLNVRLGKRGAAREELLEFWKGSGRGPYRTFR